MYANTTSGNLLLILIYLIVGGFFIFVGIFTYIKKREEGNSIFKSLMIAIGAVALFILFGYFFGEGSCFARPGYC